MYSKYGDEPEIPGLNELTQEEKENIHVRSAIIGCVTTCVALAIGLILCVILGSCTTTEYVTVEKVKHDTTYISKLQRDSIWLHDSIYVKEWMKGDTVYRDVDRWHTVYRETKSRDTVYQARIDSVPVPYPVIKEVEKPLSKSQRGLMWMGVLSVLALIVFFVYKVKRFLPGI